jgi:hypothetical protein
LSHQEVKVLPLESDGLSVYFVDAPKDARAQLVQGIDVNMAQEGTRHPGESGLDQVES